MRWAFYSFLISFILGTNIPSAQGGSSLSSPEAPSSSLDGEATPSSPEAASEESDTSSSLVSEFSSLSSTEQGGLAALATGALTTQGLGMAALAAYGGKLVYNRKNEKALEKDLVTLSQKQSQLKAFEENFQENVKEILRRPFEGRFKNLERVELESIKGSLDLNNEKDLKTFYVKLLEKKGRTKGVKKLQKQAEKIYIAHQIKQGKAPGLDQTWKGETASKSLLKSSRNILHFTGVQRQEGSKKKTYERAKARIDSRK